MIVAPGGFDRSLNRPMGKSALLQKAHALGARHGIGRHFVELASQDFARAFAFTLAQSNFGIAQRFAGDAVAFNSESMRLLP